MSLGWPFEDDSYINDQSFQSTIVNNLIDRSADAHSVLRSDPFADTTANLLELSLWDPFSNSTSQSRAFDPFTAAPFATSENRQSNAEKMRRHDEAKSSSSSSSKTRFGNDPFAPIPLDAFSFNLPAPPLPAALPQPRAAPPAAVVQPPSKLVHHIQPTAGQSSSSLNRVHQLEQQLTDMERNFGDILEHSSAQAWSIVEDQKQQINELQAKLRSSHRDLLQKESQLLCVICQDRIRSTVFLPCRHCCVCTECAQLKQRACALCKQSIESILEIYLS